MPRTSSAVRSELLVHSLRFVSCSVRVELDPYVFSPPLCVVFEVVVKYVVEPVPVPSTLLCVMGVDVVVTYVVEPVPVPSTALRVTGVEDVDTYVAEPVPAPSTPLCVTGVEDVVTYDAEPVPAPSRKLGPRASKIAVEEASDRRVCARAFALLPPSRRRLAVLPVDVLGPLSPLPPSPTFL